MREQPDDYDDFDEYDEYDERDFPACPRCNGDGYVNCYCGGDQCYCDNHGEAACPVCWGEGEVSQERYDRYMENLRKNNEMMREIMAKAEAEPTPSLSGRAR